ncbi:MAG: hypothetical protein CBC38_02875 [Gammaproteobacteria bacterium TMED78]|nr:MAG: hypothetical protein CBC38_02875 [Gammaproteobacteria bacterium TMED78]
MDVFIKKYTISKDHIDTNGHLNEVGFYYYAGLMPWALGKEKFGDDFIKKHNIGPVIFDTTIKFLKEIFQDEEIKMTLEFSDLIDRGRKFTRTIEIFNKNGELCAVVTSHGGFMNLETRRIVVPPEEVYEVFLKN